MNHVMEAVGWTLVNFCWQAALVAVMYRVLDLLCHRRSSQTRYLLSLSALLFMGVCAAATMIYEVIRISASVPVQTDTAFNLTSSLALSVPQEVGAALGHSVLGPLSAFMVGFQALLPWVDLAWLLGVACFSIRTMNGWRSLEELRSEHFGHPPSPVLESFFKICAMMRLRNVSLRISEHVGDPLTMGVLRPLILMPASAILGLSQEQMEVVLAHELAHVARMDYLWNLIQTALETLFFFHPAVWWLGRRIRHQRELCCDDAALTIYSDRHAYATALLHLEELRRSRTRLVMALTGSQSPSNLRERIARILGQKPPTRRGWSNRPLSVAALLVALGLFFVPLPKVFGRRVVTEAQNPSTLRALSVVASPQAGNKSLATLPRQHSTSTRRDSGRVMRSIAPGGYSSPEVVSKRAHEIARLHFGQQAPNGPRVTGASSIPPGYAASLRAVGILPKNRNQLISLHMFGVTPAFVTEMRAAGFTVLSANQAVYLRIQGVTPSYAASIKRQLPDATVHEVIELWIMHVDANYIATVRRDGVKPLTVMKLIRLYVVGYDLPDNENTRHMK